MHEYLDMASGETQTLIEYKQNYLTSGKQIYVFIMDFPNAFDKVHEPY